jgi:hypothetical protein
MPTAGSSHSRPFAEYPLRTTETTTAGMSQARQKITEKNNMVQRQYADVMRSTDDARQLNALFWVNPEQAVR